MTLLKILGKGQVRSHQWIKDANLKHFQTDEQVALVNFELDVPPGMDYLPHKGLFTNYVGTILQFFGQLKYGFCKKSALIGKKSEPKVFNWSEFHFSEVTSYKIHTLVETSLSGD